jgi:hypothetical protein
MKMSRKRLWIIIAEILAVSGIILTALKLCGVINIPLVWALAPIWIPLAVLALFAIIITVVLISIKRTKILDD